MYLIYNEQTIVAPLADEVTRLFAEGFLWGRKHPGYIYTTRSLRLDLAEFTLTSENRRILKKHNLDLVAQSLPLASVIYRWQIHALGKKFYSQKFPETKFSAAKIRELLTVNHNFNLLFNFTFNSQPDLGYAISYQNEEILHYSYPFYKLELSNSNLGMYMMLQAILWAQMHGKRFVYLGGVTRPTDKYKLQFNGLEWWDIDSGSWTTDLDLLKTLLL